MDPLSSLSDHNASMNDLQEILTTVESDDLNDFPDEVFFNYSPEDFSESSESSSESSFIISTTSTRNRFIRNNE